ncbi:MAG: hypothetical protein J7L54_07450, partial [Elusimicrobia bacterium]|nr:hypothetical protein [Elusimicrobiota bacterium]
RRAENIYKEIVSSARIKGGQIKRAARVDAISKIYDEFIEELKRDKTLSGKIIAKFLKENVRAGDEVKIHSDFSRIKQEKSLRSAKIVEDSSCGYPAVINRGKIRIFFDWNEFLEEVKEKTMRQIAEAVSDR